MIVFTRYLVDGLYSAPSPAGALYLVLGAPTGTPDPIPMDRALHDPALLASFAWAPIALPLGADTAAAFMTAVITAVGGVGATRGFVWIADAADVAASPAMGIDATGTQVENGLSAPLVIGLSIEVQAGMAIALVDDGAAFALDGAATGARIQLTGSAAPVATRTTSGVLHVADGQAGAIELSQFLQRESLDSALSWGFQLLYPAPADSLFPALSGWSSLADGNSPNPTDMLGFVLSVNPAAPTGGGPSDGVWMQFTGTNQDGSATRLDSFFRTTTGAAVRLWPIVDGAADTAARLVLTPGMVTSGSAQEFQMAPVGDFDVDVDGATGDGVVSVMCGLQGTEAIVCQSRTAQGAGDKLRFTPRKPAFARDYPFVTASPLGPPMDPLAPLLFDDYWTSWLTVVRAAGAGQIAYVAQPKGASLYGRGTPISSGDPRLLGARQPAVIVAAEAMFPMIPYTGAELDGGAGSFTPDQTEQLERLVVGPTRRKAIGAGAGNAQSPRRSLGLDAATTAADEAHNTTTPSGLLVRVEDGRWTEILLGQQRAPAQQIRFVNPAPILQQAFQTSDQFVVVANGDHLGRQSGHGAAGADEVFDNVVTIEGWTLRARVGWNQYNDYRNVLIVKGTRGAIYDPTTDASRKASLLANPDKWTQKTELAAPSTVAEGQPAPGAPRPSELSVLARWLQDYFQRAHDHPDQASFARFNAIAKSPDWTGILVLRMDIAGVPPDLAGIMAGVTAPDAFVAHHFGIEISQIQNDPGSPDISVADTSSMFGLIDYVDPAFVPPAAGQPTPAVPQISGAPYEFRLLDLQVLFANTAIRAFRADAQITVNQLFGMVPARMGDGGNPYNAILLRGTYQNNNGAGVFGLSSAAPATFYYDNNLLPKIEIARAQMATRDPGLTGKPPTVVSWFGLSGLLDFGVVRVSDAVPFDVFSFGNADGADLPGKGLWFDNLGLKMAFPTADPTAVVIGFEPTEIRFDTARSTPRPGSLYLQFVLQLQSLVRGDAESSPSDQGYSPVISDARLSGTGDGDWFGLRYQLNLGTPGKLAGEIGLNAYLLTAWTANSPPGGQTPSYQGTLALALPGTGGGAKLLSLQTVLKLSIGQLRLTYDASATSFLLMFTEIALKFLGLLKIPPNGSTLFYLFGNPKGDGEPSGLGWYAKYQQDPPKLLARPADEEAR
jgi:hypothetical protein